MEKRVQILGGGLAGCEAANVLTRYGFAVDLYEMRPAQKTPAHKTDRLAELVCSNSLRSESTGKPVGILKREMMALGSLVMEAALTARVPAGEALAVDREIFAQWITDRIEKNPLITLHREEISELNALLAKGPLLVATGPLTSPKLAETLKPLTGSQDLYFYDAISPIIDAASLNREKIFAASRWEKGEDYLNCPMDEEQYYNFVRHLRKGQRVLLKDFEKEIYFEGCLPIEVMADRGDLTLAYGPMKPVGLIDPRTGEQAFAVVQLRKENQEAVAYNMVGFQTKLTYPEQVRIFRMIPGLETAEFFRLGSIHRNTYINSPRLLNKRFALKAEPRIHFAGQITGTEGYVESAALGVLVGLALAYDMQGKTLALPPATTSLGALAHYLTGEPRNDFQPMNVNFGIFSALPADKKRKKKETRKTAYDERARVEFTQWLHKQGLPDLGLPQETLHEVAGR